MQVACDTVVGLDQKKQYLSSSHTFGKWFSRFMRGARLRMGMVRRQNEALTSELVLRMCSVAEGEWRAAQNPARQINVEDTVCFMLLGFGAGLRGEEVPLVNLEGLLTFWMETREEEDRYMMITLQGRFKGEVDQRWHIVPICDVTRSGIPFRLWMERIMYRWFRLQGRSNGWLFEQKPGKPAKFGIYQDYFRTLIDLTRQQDPRLLSSSVETTDFSVGDHQPQCRHQGHRADQPVAQEGSSERLRGGTSNEAGIHPSAKYPAHHEGILPCALGKGSQG